MPPKAPLNPRNFPRPPLLERTARHLQIRWNGVLIADTKDAYWVLETTHPPSEYATTCSALGARACFTTRDLTDTCSSILPSALIHLPATNKVFTRQLLRVERAGHVLEHRLPLLPLHHCPQQDLVLRATHQAIRADQRLLEFLCRPLGLLR